jgi:Tfp pilus assembly protein PilE
MRNRSFGFTLIELLGVIAIIVMLSTLVLAIAKHASDKADQSKVEADLEKWVTAAEKKFEATGYYSRPDTSGLPTKDPWGNAYDFAEIDVETGRACQVNRHSCPNQQKLQFIAWSLGPDGKAGVAGVNDDKEQRNNNDKNTDVWMDGGTPRTDIKEVGYGDDIVAGNCTIKKGFN